MPSTARLLWSATRWPTRVKMLMCDDCMQWNIYRFLFL
jgi:hypothetical protein